MVTLNANEGIHTMSFTDNQHGNNFLENLRQQKDISKFCDVVIYVGNAKFFLHKNILATVSAYFAKHLQPRKCCVERFDIAGHHPSVFQHFVDFVYSGAVVINKHNAAELLKLSHRLEVGKLKMYCAEYFERNINSENCFVIKTLAKKFELPLLLKHAHAYIKSHIVSLLTQKEYLFLQSTEMQDFLSEKELELPDMQKIRFTLEWVKHDVHGREKHLKSFLSLIKWNQVDIQYINDMIENENLFATSELSLYLILKYLNECGISFSKFHGVLEALNHKYGHMALSVGRDTVEKIRKISSKANNRKRKRLLRANPLARLAAIKSALLLRRKMMRRKHRSPKAESLAKSQNSEETDGDAAILKCHLCEHFANDTTSLEQHLSNVHSRDVTYKCGVCGFVCQWNNLYLQHIRSHFPGPPHKCDSCDFTSDRLNMVMSHRSVHLEEKTYKCFHCSFRTRTHSSLVTHAKLHNNVSSAAEKGGHLGSECRNYVCDICGFNTKYLSHLIAHKRIHSGDIYRCSYPHCKFTTGKKTQLGSHSKSHQGVRPHCCQICGRGFLEKSHLVRHERIHLEEKPFKCHECDYASSRRDKLKEHQARHHGDNASAKVPYKARPNKKSSQMFPESYSPGDGRNQTSSSSEIQEVLVQHHNLTASNVAAYPTFTSPDAHHNASTTVATLEFHQQQLLSTTNRSKDHRTMPQTAAAAVTAAMILDPRFHHGNATNTYVTPVASVVAPPGSQVNPSGHHVEYPTALMSLF